MSESLERHGLHALVVDDDDNIRLLAKATLEGIGFHVCTAGNGAEALAQLDRFQPDIVLLDVVMPRIDGYDLCVAIRARTRFLHTPILMMTGLEDMESISRAYEAGATDFVTKPVNWELLKHRVRYIVRATVAFQALANAQRVARLGSWEWEIENDVVIASDELNRVFGVQGGELATSGGLTAAVHPEDRAIVREARRQAIRHGESYEIGYRIQRPDGRARFVRENGDIVRSPDGPVTRLVGTIQDITERRAVEEEIAHLAYNDPLTGLPNRRAFREGLDQALRRPRPSDQQLALFYFDLDGFKRINDNYGHTSGDLVLEMVGQRLIALMRRWDPRAIEGDAVALSLARLGGDEFVLIRDAVESDAAAARSAREVLGCFDRPFVVKGTKVWVTPSIGVTMHPRDGSTIEELMKNADIAMYHAKETGRNNYRVFTRDLHERTQRRLLIEREIQEALRRGQLHLEYQPIVRAIGGDLAAAEALLRWTHPELGVVPPSEFVPVAEETGSIHAIGEWVLDEAVRQCRDWQDIRGEPTRVSVNVSGVQLRSGDLADVVASAIDRASFDPALLLIELTETVLMEDAEGAARQLDELRNMGTRVSVDDFGTGYSSLSYLHRLPLHNLKIDRSFIDGIAVDGDTAAIVEAIVAMAHKLGLSVTAEGVERSEDLAVIQEAGCETVQGYYFARPLSNADFIANWLQPGASEERRRAA